MQWWPILDPIVAVGLAGPWARGLWTTMALLPSLWLSCGGGVFKTFEDVLLPIRHMGVEAGIPSIDNALSHVAAVMKRHVSSTFQAYSRLLPRCVHAHD